MNGRRAVALALALLFAPASGFVPSSRGLRTTPAFRPLHVMATEEGVSEAEKRVQELMALEVSHNTALRPRDAFGRACRDRRGGRGVRHRTAPSAAATACLGT
jgi:hypothetical protein